MKRSLAPVVILVWNRRKSITSVAAHILFALVLYRMINAVDLISSDMALVVSALAVILLFLEHQLEFGGRGDSDSNRR